MSIKNDGLGRHGAVMRLDHFLEGFQARAALRFVAAGAGLVGFGHCAALGFLAQMFFDLFVAEGMTEAHEHERDPDPLLLLRIIIID